MIHKLSAVASLSFSELWLFIQAWVTLLVIDLGLRFGSYTRVHGVVSRRVSQSHSPAPSQADELVTMARQLVEKAGRNHLVPMTCLRRALALQWLLARRNIATQLRFGARKEGENLQAHAWLEYQGLPIGEPEKVEEEFLPLLPFS